ncbi:MAG: 1-hydroxycarotenoid 3,4-desaturase CrtD [Bacteroidota bacterium]
MVRVAIIGAGIAGIACSIRLALKGFEVDVYEAQRTPGGKIASFTQDSFRFDRGPSLFTMPELVEELFALAHQDPRAYLSYKRLPVACRYFYEDKTILTAYTDAKQFGQEVSGKLGIAAEVVEHYLARSGRLFELTRKTFLERSLHQWPTYASSDARQLLMRIFQLPLMSSLNQVNTAQLKHPKLVQLFNRFATYQGANPYTAAGMLQMIPHLEHNIGTFFPQGGTYSIIQQLFKLSKQLGVRYHFSTLVEEILVSQGSTQGIRIGTEKIPTDVVVSNMDVVATYQRLLPCAQLPRQFMQQGRSSSALIFYWGMDAVLQELSLHNIFFSTSYQQEFEAIFRHQRIADDPTVYVHVSAKENATDAPVGQENWFVMINVPADQGQRWDELVVQARTNVLGKLTRMLATAIEPLIVSESIWDPRCIAADTLAHQGAIYGADTSSQLAVFRRHPNFSWQFKGLYFCGGTVHPGGGIPLCLFSAKIVAELIEQAYFGPNR